MKRGTPAVVLRAGDAPVRTITIKCAFATIGVLITASAGAIDEAAVWPPPMEAEAGSECIGGYPGVAGAEQACSPGAAEKSPRRQVTLGSILDQGAKKMSRAEIRAAISDGRLREVPTPGLEQVTSRSDGTISGRTKDGLFWIYGEWKIDDRDRQCFYWDGWRDGYGGAYCYSWFKLGDSIYWLDSGKDADRSMPVSRLTPR